MEATLKLESMMGLSLNCESVDPLINGSHGRKIKLCFDPLMGNKFLCDSRDEGMGWRDEKSEARALYAKNRKVIMASGSKR